MDKKYVSCFFIQDKEGVWMDYYIMVGREKVIVSEIVYKTWCRGERKERYFREGDVRNGVFSYDALDTEDFNGCDLFSDPEQLSTEGMAEKNLMLEQLKKVLTNLEEDEKDLIFALYVQEESLRQVSRRKNVPLSTLQYRHKKILKKLKSYLEHMFVLPDESCNVTSETRKQKEKRDSEWDRQ